MALVLVIECMQIGHLDYVIWVLKRNAKVHSSSNFANNVISGFDKKNDLKNLEKLCWSESGKIGRCPPMRTDLDEFSEKIVDINGCDCARRPSERSSFNPAVDRCLKGVGHNTLLQSFGIVLTHIFPQIRMTGDDEEGRPCQFLIGLSFYRHLIAACRIWSDQKFVAGSGCRSAIVI